MSSCWRASNSGGWGPPQPHKPNGKPEQLKYSGVVKKKDSEVYVGNVPPEMKEEDILLLLRDFHPQRIKRCHSGLRSYAFVDLGSSEQVQAAIQRFSGHLVNGRRLFLSRTGAGSGRKDPAGTQRIVEMPALERVPRGELGLSQAKAENQTLQPAPPDAVRQICYAVPMEMRGSFLTLMLKDCFKDLNWLVSIAKLHGEAGLLVTDALPQTPYFWAIHLTEESHSNMHKLFCQLAEEESKQPYLTKQAVQRGTRCMAECILGDDGAAWNRFREQAACSEWTGWARGGGGVGGTFADIGSPRTVHGGHVALSWSAGFLARLHHVQEPLSPLPSRSRSVPALPRPGNEARIPRQRGRRTQQVQLSKLGFVPCWGEPPAAFKQSTRRSSQAVRFTSRTVSPGTMLVKGAPCGVPRTSSSHLASSLKVSHAGIDPACPGFALPV
ncbi:tudor domain-containing protein 10 isoform X2 [Terrapene carolina triunguis]|uniref:tudor domain-containing protein 10 isoform X2 n=1 Tax=Terrapene triunguis TaxID=2587831 RepID=UPI0011561BBA|nr:tudor domain-containing protein 10 isoform X2 [Terrapene carolina triunguis]